MRYRTRSSGLPGNAAEFLRHPSGQLGLVSLFGLAPRGVYLAATVTSHAGELLPHRFTHHLLRGRNILCCTCRRTFSRTPGRYPARRPMVFGLSSSAFAEAITRRASLSRLRNYNKECSTIQFDVTKEINFVSRSHRRPILSDRAIYHLLWSGDYAQISQKPLFRFCGEVSLSWTNLLGRRPRSPLGKA